MCYTLWNPSSPCCGPIWVTHRKLVGGAAGGTKVWDADRGNVSGLNIPPSENGATCYGIRIDGTQVYTIGNRSQDEWISGPLLGFGYKTIYLTKSPVFAPTTFTLVVDPSATGVFFLDVATGAGSGTTLPIQYNATATDVKNAILATTDSSSGIFVNSGDFTITGGPLGTNAIVMTSTTGATVSLTASGIGGPLMSPYRNTAEAWKKDGTIVWSRSVPGDAQTGILIDGGNVNFAQVPFTYSYNNVVVYPAYITTGSGSAFTLACWDGVPGNAAPDTITHPQPAGGYFMVFLGSTNGTMSVGSLTSPLPIDATAAQVQTALQATSAAANVGGTITCAGGPLPGSSISISLSALSAGKSWGSVCTVTDTLLGDYNNGTALWQLSAIDGSVQASNSWGMRSWLATTTMTPRWISKNGSIIYVTGAAVGGNPSDHVTWPGCRGDGPTGRTFDASLNPEGDQTGIGGGGAWDVCFNSSGTVCYSASSSGVLGINTDFTTGSFAFDISGGHLIPAGHITLMSDSILIATWSNQVGTFSTATGHNIANATLPNMPAPGAGAGDFSPVCTDGTYIYVGVGNRFVGGSQIDDCVACYDVATLTLQWTHNYTGSVGSSLGSIKSICCEPDGSYVYFGGNRLIV